jgi:hypothetical protein
MPGGRPNGSVAVGGLAEPLRANAEIVHFFSKFAPGVQDAVWIPQIAREEGWIVVSADRGKHSRQGAKLPQICSAFGVTHVMLTAALAKRNWYYKSLAFESHWAELLAMAQCPKGTGFKLSIAGERSFRLRKVSEPPLPEGPQRQQTLFQPPEKK